MVRCCLINNNRNLQMIRNSYEYWWLEKPPAFELPELVSQYSFVPSLEQLNSMEGLCITKAQSNLYEEETREQADTHKWHDLWTQRLSSSKFKEVCTRRADFESLAARQLKKTIQTAAIRHGISTKEKATAAYADIGECNVFPLESSSTLHALNGLPPDRRVYDPSEINR